MSSPTDASPSRTLRLRFKAPEGRYVLLREKLQSTGIIQYAHQRNPTKVVAVLLQEPQASTTPSSAQGTPSFSTGPRLGRSFFGAGASRGLGFGGSGNLWGSSANRASTGQQPVVTTLQGGGGSATPADPSSLQLIGVPAPDVPEPTGASQGPGVVTAQSQHPTGGVVGTGIGAGIGIGVGVVTAGGSAGGGGAGGGVLGETGSSTAGGSNSSSSLPPAPPALSVDGPGAYILFNVGDSLLIADASSPEKEPIKCISFAGTNGVVQSFQASLQFQLPDRPEAHDLLIGTTAGELFTASLRQQLQDTGKKLLGATQYNKDNCVSSSRLSAVSWLPSVPGQFASAHADGNIFIFDTAREGTVSEASLPALKDPSSFSVAHARSPKSNPMARWHISSSAVISFAFSPSSACMAVVSRDGYLRVFDREHEVLESGCRSYYGSFLCCAVSPDSRLVLAGGEDDLVTVWSREQKCVLARCEGHSSWVSDVAFDPFFPSRPDDTSLPSDASANLFSLPPAAADSQSDDSTGSGSGGNHASSGDKAAGRQSGVAGVGAAAGGAVGVSGSGSGSGIIISNGNNDVYRFGSVAQDTRLLLWDLSLSDLASLRLSPQSPSFSSLPSIHPSASLVTAPLELPPSFTGQNPSQSEGSTSTAAGNASVGSSSVGGNHNNSIIPSARPGSATSMSGKSLNGVAVTGNSNTNSSSSSNNNTRSTVLLLAPSRKEVPCLSPVVAHKVHNEPLSSLLFTKDAIITACHEGQVKIWLRPR